MVLILDGGSTSVLDHIAISDKDQIMNSPLWTSQALFSCPQAVTKMYEEYIASGADLVSCMTYQQSSITMNHVRDVPDAYDVGMSVAIQACRHGKAVPVLTLGTHAAMLSNGAEYNHKYKSEDTEMLRKFHTERLTKFAAAKSWHEIQYIAFETLPDVLEAKIILEVLTDLPKDFELESKKIWISFSCSGEKAVDKVLAGLRELVTAPQLSLLWGLGLNCFKEDVAQVVDPFCDILAETDLHAVLYRDAGPQWDPVNRVFQGETMDPGHWAERAAADAKLNKGRTVVGGCCQTTPGHIAALRACLVV